MDLTIDERLERLRKLIPDMKSVREISDSAVLVIGHEFDESTRGIFPGNDWIQRANWARAYSDSWFDLVSVKLPDMFRRIVALCRQNYGYKIAYDASPNEVDLVPRSDPSSGSVDVGACFVDGIGFGEDWIMNVVSRLKKFHVLGRTTTFKGAYANPWPIWCDHKLLFMNLLTP